MRREEKVHTIDFLIDYVFGVPLARNYPRIHRNVNMSYYNYSNDEEDFSRQMIRYWSNFIKTGFVHIELLLIKIRSRFLLEIRMKVHCLRMKISLNGKHIRKKNIIISIFN